MKCRHMFCGAITVPVETIFPSRLTRTISGRAQFLNKQNVDVTRGDQSAILPAGSEKFVPHPYDKVKTIAGWNRIPKSPGLLALCGRKENKQQAACKSNLREKTLLRHFHSFERVFPTICSIFPVRRHFFLFNCKFFTLKTQLV
jgi:hypothetical protein